jgi:epoxyqueuosine reductase QueG
MKETVIATIRQFVALYQQDAAIRTRWGVPLVGFAAADDPLFAELKQVVSPTHAVPRDILATARTVIAFFLPFARSMTATNVPGRLSSTEWAVAYLETNEMIARLSDHLQELFRTLGAESCTIPATHNWNEEKLMSDWSHRHIAYVAGLGNFGLNNMLITSQGCCGRLGSFVTSHPLPADIRPEGPACLYKFDGSCRKCVRRCVGDALHSDSFNRFRCYDILLKNVDEHAAVGYADVCGKCLVAVPCSHADPVALKLRRNSGGNRQAKKNEA